MTDASVQFQCPLSPPLSSPESHPAPPSNRLVEKSTGASVSGRSRGGKPKSSSRTIQVTDVSSDSDDNTQNPNKDITTSTPDPVSSAPAASLESSEAASKNGSASDGGPKPDTPRDPAQRKCSSAREKRVQCPWCSKYFVNLQGHSCPQKQAAQKQASAPGGPSAETKNWPFASLAQMSYVDIFCSPMTLYDVPSEERALFSAVVCEIVKHILGGQKEAWKAFFLLPRLVLALPRGGRGVAKLVHTYLLLFRAGEWSALLKRPFRSMGESRGEFNKEKRAISLARVGYFSGATRALADCSPADTADPKVYKNLIDLHPAASRLSGELQLNPANVISEDIFLKVLSTTPPRRAPDAAGWRGDYFKSFSPEARIMVFKLVEHILQNPKSLPADLRPFFFGARLTALHKPNGGIRPIAVGVILRKLVSTTLVNTISAQLPDTFYPHQHGTGTPGGAENVVQGLRLAQALDRENVVVGIDFSNAFNTMDRQAICDQVVDKFPQLRTWFELSYGKPSRLLVKGQRPISSAKGVQQGDPLGPFFFALALQPVLQKAAANGSCVLAYLDDVHICGKPSVVAPAVKVLLEEAAKIGLQCNLNKCWATKAVDVDNNRLPIVTKPVVLGAPLDVDQKLQTDIIPEQLMKSVAGLPDLQMALHLMRYLHNSRFIYQFPSIASATKSGSSF